MLAWFRRNGEDRRQAKIRILSKYYVVENLPIDFRNWIPDVIVAAHWMAS